MLEKNNLAKIRKNVEDCIGKKVILKANKGRKKTTVREGILEEAYPSLFVVRIYNQFDSMRRVSYTYSDILTQTVEVTICDDTDRQQIKIS
ncbi:Veg family protein [Schnuerera sp. xch1]|nr:Veg family protein [Schnuerera sp. xch1]MBZ2175083.1 Veg family protein [Schnuerera sp. xch1]